MAQLGQIEWRRSQLQLLSSDAAGQASFEGGGTPVEEIPKGCGTIIGKRHAITCTHVVMACLGLPYRNPASDISEREVLARFPIDPAFDFNRARTIVKFRVHSWSPHHAAYNIAHEDNYIESLPESLANRFEEPTADDLCVLELVGKESLPSFLCPAVASDNALQAGTEYVGRGLHQSKPGGCELEGKVKGEGLYRNQITTPEEIGRDLKTVAGCSGAGIFHKDTGELIGMISDKEGHESGCAIDIVHLKQACCPSFWNGFSRSANRVANSYYRVGLLKEFKLRFDRDPPRIKFEEAFKKARAKRRLGITYVVGGTSEDEIDQFFERLRHTLGFGKELLEEQVTLSPNLSPQTTFEKFKSQLSRYRPEQTAVEDASLAPAVFCADLSIDRFRSTIVQEALRLISAELIRRQIDSKTAPVFFFIGVEMQANSSVTRAELELEFLAATEKIKSTTRKQGIVRRLLFPKVGESSAKTMDADAIETGPMLDVFTVGQIKNFVRISNRKRKVDLETCEKQRDFVQDRLSLDSEIAWKQAKEVISQAENHV